MNAELLDMYIGEQIDTECLLMEFKIPFFKKYGGTYEEIDVLKSKANSDWFGFDVQFEVLVKQFERISKLSKTKELYRKNVSKIYSISSTIFDMLIPKYKYVGDETSVLIKGTRDQWLLGRVMLIKDSAQAIIKKQTKYIPDNIDELTYKISTSLALKFKKFPKQVKESFNVYIEEAIENENIKSALLISTLVILFQLLISSFQVVTLMIQKKKLDSKRTKKIREITGNKKVEVWQIKQDGDVNAFVFFGKRLYYCTGIVKQLGLTEDELIAILLHEYTHYTNNHSLKNIIMVIPCTYLSTFCIAYLGNIIKLPGKFIGGLITTLSWIPSTLIALVFGKKWEYQSDAGAVTYGYGVHMQNALKKVDLYMRSLVCQEVKNINSAACNNIMKDMHKWDEHPDVRDRIDSLRSKKGRAELKSIIRLAGLKAKHIIH